MWGIGFERGKFCSLGPSPSLYSCEAVKSCQGIPEFSCSRWRLLFWPQFHLFIYGVVRSFTSGQTSKKSAPTARQTRQTDRYWNYSLHNHCNTQSILHLPPYQPFDQSTVMALVSFSPPLIQGSFKHTFTSHSGISCQFSVFLIFWERIPTTNSRHNDRPNTSDVRDETHFYDRFALLHHFALLLGWCCLFCTGLSDSKFKHQQPNQFIFLFFLGSFTKEWKVRGNGNGTSPTVACLCC